MIRVWDNELLAATKQHVELVTDGLLCWFDGRDAPPTNLRLHDRVTNTDYSYQSQSGSFPGFTQYGGKYIYISLTSNCYGGIIPSRGASTETYEFVTSPATVFAYGYDNGCVLYVGNKARTGSNKHTVSATYRSSTQSFSIKTDEYPAHVVVKRGSVTINGTKYTAENELNPAAYYGLRINSWANTEEYIGAIRMYNRELTDAEILQNYQYEKQLGRA